MSVVRKSFRSSIDQRSRTAKNGCSCVSNHIIYNNKNLHFGDFRNHAYAWQEFQPVVQAFVYEGIASDEELAEIEESIQQVRDFLKQIYK